MRQPALGVEMPADVDEGDQAGIALEWCKASSLPRDMPRHSTSRAAKYRCRSRRDRACGRKMNAHSTKRRNGMVCKVLGGFVVFLLR